MARFALSFLRHTGRWVELYDALPVDECLKAIRDDPWFQPKPHHALFTFAFPHTAGLPRGRPGTLHAFDCTWPTTCAPAARTVPSSPIPRVKSILQAARALVTRPKGRWQPARQPAPERSSCHSKQLRRPRRDPHAAGTAVA
jgi:hypothetical protein